jgi:hypothetical protein
MGAGGWVGAGRARTGQLTQPNSIPLDATALLSCSLLYNLAHSAWPRLQQFLTTRQGCKHSSQTGQPRLKRFFKSPLRKDWLQGYPIKGYFPAWPRLQVYLTAKTIFRIPHSPVQDCKYSLQPKQYLRNTAWPWPRLQVFFSV